MPGAWGSVGAIADKNTSFVISKISVTKISKAKDTPMPTRLFAGLYMILYFTSCRFLHLLKKTF